MTETKISFEKIEKWFTVGVYGILTFAVIIFGIRMLIGKNISVDPYILPSDTKIKKMISTSVEFFYPKNEMQKNGCILALLFYPILKSSINLVCVLRTLKWYWKIPMFIPAAISAIPIGYALAVAGIALYPCLVEFFDFMNFPHLFEAMKVCFHSVIG